jgi:hypothetical protein
MPSNLILHKPSATHLHGLYDPEGDGLTFYVNAAERDTAAEKVIQNYFDGNEWFEEVTGVFAFMVTHRAMAVDMVRPVGKIDPDSSCDEVGEYWPSTDCECKCNYAMKKVSEIES